MASTRAADTSRCFCRCHPRDRSARIFPSSFRIKRGKKRGICACCVSDTTSERPHLDKPLDIYSADTRCGVVVGLLRLSTCRSVLLPDDRPAFISGGSRHVPSIPASTFSFNKKNNSVIETLIGTSKCL